MCDRSKAQPRLDASGGNLSACAHCADTSTHFVSLADSVLDEHGLNIYTSTRLDLSLVSIGKSSRAQLI